MQQSAKTASWDYGVGNKRIPSDATMVLQRFWEFDDKYEEKRLVYYAWKEFQDYYCS